MVKILDSTLREGEQTPGVAFPSHSKLSIATMLDEIGVDILEAGHPVVSDQINQTVGKLASHHFKNLVVGAHARSLRRDIDLAIDAGVGFLGIFFCVAQSRLDSVFKCGLEEAVDRISEMIAYAKERNPALIVRYTPEDTVRSDFENVVRASVAACKAGADIISIADTTGAMIPGSKRSLYDFTLRLKDRLGAEGLTPQIAVHCHNDRGLALANAIDGYRAGVDIIDTCVLGLGERAGITDLASLLSLLSLDFGEDHWDLKGLVPLYDFVSRTCRMPIPKNAPIVGENAFTHCAGVHTQAAKLNPKHYESLSPEVFGRNSFVSLDNMSGTSSVLSRLEDIGVLNPDRTLVETILQEVKEIGQSGRMVGNEELEEMVRYFRSPAQDVTRSQPG